MRHPPGVRPWLAALGPPNPRTVPVESWPESLLDLARERVAQTGDSETAREEVWISWCEWKAREMNRLFQEHGLMGQPGQIKPKTTQDGMERAARRRSR
jgi:hypothetical protein